MRKLVIALFCMLLFAGMTAAEVSLTQPKTLYNLGDLLDVSASINVVSETDSLLEINLVCENESRHITSESLYLDAGQEYRVEKIRPLTPGFLGGLRGNCQIRQSYGSEVSYSQFFQITDKINLVLSSDKTSVNPGENIILKINAIKANSELLEGYADINVDGSISTLQVSSGKLQANFSYPSNAKSGNHDVKVTVYEKSKDEVTNYGEESISMTVKQVPEKLELVVDKYDVVPGSSIKLIPVIYDQADDKISGSIKISVFDSNEEEILSRFMRGDEEIEIQVAENDSSGKWEISGESLGLESKKNFYVSELKKARFEIRDGGVIEITNLGNVPYDKEIKVMIGDSLENFTKIVPVNSVEQVSLSAPDGDYTIVVMDDSEQVTGTAYLTGNAIGINDVGNALALFNRYPIVWFFLILVMGLFVFTMSKRVLKSKFYGFLPAKFKEKKEQDKKEERVINLSPSRKVEEAEHSLVLNGSKETTSVLALKIRNSENLKGVALDSMKNVEESIKSHKGSVYKTGNEIVGIFAPSSTKTFKNEIAAVRVASEIAAHLNEHNKQFKEKIDFGIGIHSGEMAVKIENGRLKFTPLGNAINLAKKISDSASNTALLSSQVNKKIAGEVKTLKQGEFYSISRIVEREQHKSFLTGFKERNNFK